MKTNNVILSKCKVFIKPAICLIIIGLFALFCVGRPYDVSALSKMGSQGQEVKKIQRRLKKRKFFKGKVDGVYGKKTYKAVIRFQKKKGLSPDGICGIATLNALGIKTKSVAKNNNAKLLARVINGESRGEPYLGMVAVGAVVLNRVKDPRFPKTVSAVIYEKGAFDAVADGQINLEPTNDSVKAARDALNGWDPTKGCIFYYNPTTATNKWIWSRPIKMKIGQHNFCT